jgi:TIR domain
MVDSGRIFISYRRAETAYPAGWLYDRLVENYGPGLVFKDVDPIELGDDVADVIATAVGACDVLLALIGDEWLTAADPAGQRRLDDPADFVRLEIESALARDVRIIPVLVDGAHMPGAEELPPSLARLARRQALELSPSQFGFDTGRLLRVLDRSLAEVQAQRDAARGSGSLAREAGIVAAVLAVLAALVVLALVFSAPSGTGTARPSGGARVGDVLLADDFSTAGNSWSDAFHAADGHYTKAGTYYLRVTGGASTGEFAGPAGARHGLGDRTSLNLSLAADMRIVAGSPASSGSGFVCRSDGAGDFYAFVLQHDTVAISKWTAGGSRELGRGYEPITAARPAGLNHVTATCATSQDGRSVALTLAVNGQTVATYTDTSHPYTTGYLGIYVITNSAAPATAAAEFDNLTITRI